jgi:hypothetical protein
MGVYQPGRFYQSLTPERPEIKEKMGAVKPGGDPVITFFPEKPTRALPAPGSGTSGLQWAPENPEVILEVSFFTQQVSLTVTALTVYFFQRFKDLFYNSV